MNKLQISRYCPVVLPRQARGHNRYYPCNYCCYVVLQLGTLNCFPVKFVMLLRVLAFHHLDRIACVDAQ
uniref:Uncharacterized protein n=1 Tax=Arundo donax TaxID=35708 RepID=A0A0A9FSZ3_ARUDO